MAFVGVEEEECGSQCAGSQSDGVGSAVRRVQTCDKQGRIWHDRERGAVFRLVTFSVNSSLI
mgnify:CR=1 FL=1